MAFALHLWVQHFGKALGAVSGMTGLTPSFQHPRTPCLVSISLRTAQMAKPVAAKK
jgi:hypothetical protein